MKIVLDFLVLILFFGTFYLTKDIFMATTVAIVGGILQVGISWAKDRKLDAMQLINLFIIIVFGGATLILHDETWIKWKPTVLYWIFAIILLGGLASKKIFLQILLGKELTLPDFVWKNLTWAWSVFFLMLGIINLWVAFVFNLKYWVTFKTFGATGLLLLFVLIQGVYLYRYLPQNNRGKEK